VLGALLAAAAPVGCSGSPPTDINYGTDAGAGFEAPPRDVSAFFDAGTDLNAAAPDAGSADDTGVAAQDAQVGQPDASVD